MSAVEVVGRWRSCVGWPAGWVLLERGAFLALFRAEAFAILPVHSAAALLHCDPERVRSWVRAGKVRGFAYPAGHNWVALADLRALCSPSEP
jgi:hypothetical protein